MTIPTRRQHPQQTQQPPGQHPGRPTSRRLLGHRPSRGVVALLTAGLLVVVLVTIGLLTHRGEGWRTVWSDSFTGRAGSPPSAANWLTDTGTSYPGGAPHWGTAEIETFTADPANAALDGHGNLRITPLRDPSGAWTSARLETRRADFRPPPGGLLKVEARIKVPAGGPGYWSAFWMLGAPFRPAHTDWPGAGEIDVMENLGSEPGTVYGTLHCGVFGGGPCRENRGLGGSRVTRAPYSAGFHTYSVVWDRSQPVAQLRWFVDGQLFHTVRASDVDPSTWQRATGHGFFLLLNVAVGGTWPGPPDATTVSGASMLVDQVTVSRRG